MMAGNCEENDVRWGKFLENLGEQRDEVLALQSTFEDGIINTIKQPPENPDSECFILQVNVNVAHDCDSLRVEAWIPHELETESNRVESGKACDGKPCFERSQSGRRWHSSFLITHLPPLCLQLNLPPAYPSDSAPIFTLSSVWLDSGQLSSLCRELDVLWGQYHGFPVIYIWVDWLKENTFSHLGLSDSVILTPHLQCDEELFGQRDPRALPECASLREDLTNIIRYDMRKEQDTFSQTPHECGVCYEEKPGREFFRLVDCKHHFCQECLVAYCAMHVQDGTVQQLQCPDQECKSGLPPDVIRAVLGEDEYERFERLVLQRALDTMDDIEWCPRCNAAVIRESQEKLNLAYCTNCVYSFCTECRMPWHQGVPCQTLEDRLAELEEQSKDSENDPASKQSLVEKHRLWRLEYMSKCTIKKITKSCPTCKIPIEKFAGCNKVSCTQCGTFMCYECGKVIDGYNHFRSTKCNLFPAAIAYDVPQRQREVPEGALLVEQAIVENRGQLVVCPRCHQRNLKDGRNNHARCWCCKANFCCMCRKSIVGNILEHYKAGSQCSQHSD